MGPRGGKHSSSVDASWMAGALIFESDSDSATIPRSSTWPRNLRVMWRFFGLVSAAPSSTDDSFSCTRTRWAFTSSGNSIARNRRIGRLLEAHRGLELVPALVDLVAIG